MAKVRQRGKKFVYTWDDPYEPYKKDPRTGDILLSEKTGKPVRNQHTEIFDTQNEGEIFKRELEVKIRKGRYITPSTETVSDFVPRFIDVYAPINWSGSTYSSNKGLIYNHIIPDLGKILMKDVRPANIEILIAKLKKKKVKGPKSYNKEPEDIPTLSAKTVRDIYDLLNCIFSKAVEWKVIEENPVQCERPKVKKKQQALRRAWTKGFVRMALEDIQDDLLNDIIYLAFFCTTRNGETVGITIDSIDLEDGDYGSILINKTLQRIADEALRVLPDEEIQFVFPKKAESSTSKLVLKDPKTDLSTRKVYLNQKGRDRIAKRLFQIERNKAYHGDNYHDYNLLFCLPNGDPIEPKLLEKWFKKWQAATSLELPEIVFHELRHSSITYKIYISGGDIKSVGLQAGQSSVQTTEGYNHGFEENQRALARLTEDDFWGDVNIVDEDQPLDDEGKILVQYVQQLFEERMGKTMLDPDEFDTAIEYMAYVMDSLLTKRSLPMKTPVSHKSAPNAALAVVAG